MARSKFTPLCRLNATTGLAILLLSATLGGRVRAEQTPPPAAPEPNSVHFDVRGYVIRGNPSITTNIDASLLDRHTGTNLTVADLVRAAADLRAQFRSRGLPDISIAVSPREITNGIVTLNVFHAPLPQTFVAGISYFDSNAVAAVTAPLPAVAAATTNAPSATKTNAGPHFTVKAYEIHGDTLLTIEALTAVLGKYTGTNISIGDIVKAATDLQMEYRARGYPTVVVRIPQQQITNEMVRFRVIEGRLAEIKVVGNRYFSSNNVMRALPSLQTNIILSGPVLQAELDRANANQDRQIYAEMEPGAEPDTTDLRLVVKDRLPLHGKIDFNNQNSPGTPDLRLNTSIVYNNLWQYEHSIGLQYSFSPELYKEGDTWNFYDRPLVANYSGFYRLPLAPPSAVSEEIGSRPGSFGYSEATRRFNLPPSSGVPELNFYGSRSAIDTGVQSSDFRIVAQITNLTVTAHNEQQDITINQAAGSRISLPIREFSGFRSTLSGGIDYKTYEDTTDKAYVYNFIQAIPTGAGQTNYINTEYRSPVPTTTRSVDYAPLSVRWDVNRKDRTGMTFFGVGYSGNFLGVSGTNFENAASSPQASGYFQILTPSLSRDQQIFTNWWLSGRAGGQWANQPLVSTEQFGVGGVNSVRGYHEGEVFGDTGWHVSLDLKTPPHYIGAVYANHPLIVRGSIYMDYGQANLLDPQGRPPHVSLWGTGFGSVISIGATWEARFLFSWPLLSAGTVSAYTPRFDFSLSAQF